MRSCYKVKDKDIAFDNDLDVIFAASSPLNPPRRKVRRTRASEASVLLPQPTHLLATPTASRSSPIPSERPTPTPKPLFYAPSAHWAMAINPKRVGGG